MYSIAFTTLRIFMHLYKICRNKNLNKYLFHLLNMLQYYFGYFSIILVVLCDNIQYCATECMQSVI